MKNKVKYLNGSVQAVFYGLRFRSNRLKHSVKRFDRFGLATLRSISKREKIANYLQHFFFSVTFRAEDDDSARKFQQGFLIWSFLENCKVSAEKFANITGLGLCFVFEYPVQLTLWSSQVYGKMYVYVVYF